MRKPGQWWDRTYNPVSGCSSCSPACDHCYAARMARRLAGRVGYPDGDGFAVTWHESHLRDPLQWKKPSIVFVCSMGDLFHEDVNPIAWPRMWDIMRLAGQHRFVILTKRPERMYAAIKRTGVGEAKNVWLGVSVWDQESADNSIPILLQTPAAKRVVSYEPALAPVLLSSVVRLDWVIAGAETGPGARPALLGWFRQVRDQANAAGVPFFLKQIDSKRNRVLDGHTWNEKP